jgi:hypothetical protein
LKEKPCWKTLHMASVSIENLLEDLSPEELDELSGDIDPSSVVCFRHARRVFIA